MLFKHQSISNPDEEKTGRQRARERERESEVAGGL